MENELTQDSKATEHKRIQKRMNIRLLHYLCMPICKQMVLLMLTLLLLLGSVLFSHTSPDAYAANPGAGNACSWYRIHFGDTLGGIAWNTRITIQRLAYVNGIRNVNLIFAGQALCLPYAVRTTASVSGRSASGGRINSGMLPSGYVRWYAYNALQWSTQTQVVSLLHQAAWRYNVPANLLLAVAWQESGWNQHVIARDGGIGAMQIMPYTAVVLNQMTRTRLDPYKLQDNINLGALYLHTLWTNFHGNSTQVISAYNEGGWNVVHRGIFNWRYVNNVQALMQRLR